MMMFIIQLGILMLRDVKQFFLETHSLNPGPADFTFHILHQYTPLLPSTHSCAHTRPGLSHFLKMPMQKWASELKSGAF